MPTPQPTDPRRAFALEVVTALRTAGYEAYWAGGCVRDQVLGFVPDDYDVATSATPDEVRRLFGQRRTLAIGAAFGVIAVLGGKASGQVEVATFRQDAAYTDGRRPDAVTYSRPEEDARRRDFTINALFYDPLARRVIDFVGGQQDLERGIVRAVGDPQARFAEDKLRLLRAVRFAARFGFALEERTRAAVEHMAAQVTVVSAERIAQEVRAMLVHPSRAQGLVLMQETGLLAAILPEAAALVGIPFSTSRAPKGDLWDHTLALVDSLSSPSFPLVLAGLLHAIGTAAAGPATADVPANLPAHGPAAAGAHSAAGATPAARLAGEVCRRWRLANKETDRTVWLVGSLPKVAEAPAAPWTRLQRLLIAPGIEDLLALAEADVQAAGRPAEAVAHCRRFLSLPPAELNPPPLVTGNDLLALGIPQGSRIKLLLDALRDAQLDKSITTKTQALDLARRLNTSDPSPS
jgi:poly(A) polymerase